MGCRHCGKFTSFEMIICIFVKSHEVIIINQIYSFLIWRQKRFILNDTPWAHCDIAGTVWADKPGATWGKGATGYGTRLIDNFVRENVEA